MTDELQGLERLLAQGLTQEEEAIARRYYSDKERDSMDASEFCGPHKSFPIKTAEDVKNAAHLIGHADDPGAVKACVMRKAKANGWPIPDAWKDGDSDDKQERVAPALPQDALFMHLPITRIDEKEWLIEGQATSDQVDSYGTIFDYESSKKAFQKWRGNIREMHKNEAVGRAIEVLPDDETKTIFLRARISKGAKDAWLKVCDGTYQGFSIGIPPEKYKVRTITRNGKSIPVYYDHELAEVSIVDNPGSPNCDITIVRADGMALDPLDFTEEPIADTTPALEPSTSSSLGRAGARVGASTRDAMHDSLKHGLRSVVSQMKNCGCDGCQMAMKLIDPDEDGDIDLGGYDDPDSDWQSLYGNSSDESMERKISSIVERAVSSQMSIIYARLQGIAGTLARSAPHTTDEQAITRAVASSFAEVRAELSAVKEQVDKIADTPVPGAPVMNTGMTRSKQLATDPTPTASQGALYDAMKSQFEQNARVGAYVNNPQKQIDDMAQVLANQPFIARR